MVGIFWYYKGVVFGRARDISEGEDGGIGIVDSPDNHAEFWDKDQNYKTRFPELRFSEYVDIPRGRVVRSLKDDRAIVYMDKDLFTNTVKRQIINFFCLENIVVLWRTDLHYTTSQKEIPKLFDLEH